MVHTLVETKFVNAKGFTEFPSPHGEMVHTLSEYNRIEGLYANIWFPSPHGEMVHTLKLICCAIGRTGRKGFRPLTGRWFIHTPVPNSVKNSRIKSFPSPHGEMVHTPKVVEWVDMPNTCFRPLTGRWFIHWSKTLSSLARQTRWFPSPHGEMVHTLQTITVDGHTLKVSVPSRGDGSYTVLFDFFEEMEQDSGFPSPHGEMVHTPYGQAGSTVRPLRRFPSPHGEMVHTHAQYLIDLIDYDLFPSPHVEMVHTQHTLQTPCSQYFPGRFAVFRINCFIVRRYYAG